MFVVLDTNVLISACWKPSGLEAQTCDLALAGAFTVCISPHVWAEYQDVFTRKKFTALQGRAQALLLALKARAVEVHPDVSLAATSDEDDNRFLECAAAAGASFLVTGNLRHYPPSFGDIQILNARAFLEIAFPAALNRDPAAVDS